MAWMVPKILDSGAGRIAQRSDKGKKQPRRVAGA
jgi:hypothetical protein